MKRFQLKNGYLLNENGVLVDMWHNPVPYEVFHTLGQEWTELQEQARTEYLKSLVVQYRELGTENKHALLKLRDSFSKSELLDLYQNGKYLS